MTTHAIILGGIIRDITGRPLGPYRLRTALAKQGFRAEVIDYAWALKEDELLTILESFISTETLILGLSITWFSSTKHKGNAEFNRWFTESFFQSVRTHWPWLKIVIGGTKTALVHGSELLKKPADWWLRGFADIGLPELLKHLSGRENNLKFRTEYDGVHVIDCNDHYRVENMDELETEYEAGDYFKTHQPVSLEVSRGCIFTCSFCTHPFLGKKSYEYIRTPESLASELRRNYEIFGTTRYIVTDDTFNDSMEKLERVARAIELSKIPNFEFVSYIRAELLVTKPELIPMLKQLNCKGAFVGLESMNKEARISVGKGMAVDRVLDALNNLKSNSNALLYASMIVGLPGDTLDDAYSWYERFKSKELFNDWGFQNLGLTFDEFGQGESIFSKEPAKYGYEVTGRNVDANGIGPRSYQWKSKMGFSDGDAGRVAREINDMSMDIVGAGGFGVADYWYHNGTEHEIDNVTRTDFFPARKGSVSGKIRSQERLQEALARLAQNGRTSKFYTNN
jgi:hypothetical protein